ncbi:hypothetical protein JCM10213v2_004853 [Rhodosporidiobolus nylandii]
MAALRLSSTCAACGEPTEVEVPRWLTAAMENATAERHAEQSRSLCGRDADEGWRNGVVGTAVGVAQAIKASPVPGLLLAALHAIIAFVLFLDQRFSLHKHLANVLAKFFEGLVEIEREVGLMRSAGEWLSVGWEATVKGIIAFAKADAPAPPSRSPRLDTRHIHSTLASRPQHAPSSVDDSAEASYLVEPAPYEHYRQSDEPGFPFYPVAPPESATMADALSGSTLHSDSGPSNVLFPSPPLEAAYPASIPHHHAQPSPAFPWESSFSVHPSYAQHHSTSVRQRSASGLEASLTRPRADAASWPGPGGGSWAGKAMLGLADRLKAL